MPIAQLLIGLLQLLFGRRLFWLFVGVGGFILGWFLVPTLFPGWSNWAQLLASVAVGFIFALLAMALQRVMAAIAGFIVLGVVAVALVQALGLTDGAGAVYWIAFLLGGVVGAVFVLATFDWALIILSSLGGAALMSGAIAQWTGLEQRWASLLILLGLAVLGIAFQARALRRKR